MRPGNAVQHLCVCTTTHRFLGTFGNAGRNIIQGPGYKTWDTSLVKQFPISEQKHLEFRAEFFNVLNHVNYLFGQFGAISAEPTPLELGQSWFGFPWQRGRRDRSSSR